MSQQEIPDDPNEPPKTSNIVFSFSPPPPNIKQDDKNPNQRPQSAKMNKLPQKKQSPKKIYSQHPQQQRLSSNNTFQLNPIYLSPNFQTRKSFLLQQSQQFSDHKTASNIRLLSPQIQRVSRFIPSMISPLKTLANSTRLIMPTPVSPISRIVQRKQIVSPMRIITSPVRQLQLSPVRSFGQNISPRRQSVNRVLSPINQIQQLPFNKPLKEKELGILDQLMHQIDNIVGNDKKNQIVPRSKSPLRKTNGVITQPFQRQRQVSPQLYARPYPVQHQRSSPIKIQLIQKKVPEQQRIQTQPKSTLDKIENHFLKLINSIV